MYNKRNRKAIGFTKKILSNHCLLCLEQRGIEKKMRLCRKCLYDLLYQTDYIKY